jgi:hypothetical protein
MRGAVPGFAEGAIGHKKAAPVAEGGDFVRSYALAVLIDWLDELTADCIPNFSC